MTSRTLEADASETNAQKAMRAEFAREVVAGLSRTPKTLPTRFLYDARGSELFEQITELDEYYPTRTEIGILEVAAPKWVAALPQRTVLVEFGSGSSTKTEMLLAAGSNIVTYVPIDVSPAALDAAASRLRERFPTLEVVPIEADFTKAVLPPALADRPLAGFFPGSTIGNFEPEIAVGLLRTFARILAPRGRLLIGADLRKDRRTLERAYDDDQGVTAAFNLNLLHRMKRELGAKLDPDGFEHLATFNAELSRVEMHLVSRHAQTIEVDGKRFSLQPGERIHTENSHKYTFDGFAEMARTAGWHTAEVWTDPAGLFSVHALELREQD